MSPADEWGRHLIVCLVCELGETPAEDTFCEAGKRLRRAANVAPSDVIASSVRSNERILGLIEKILEQHALILASNSELLRQLSSVPVLVGRLDNPE